MPTPFVLTRLAHIFDSGTKFAVKQPMLSISYSEVKVLKNGAQYFICLFDAKDMPVALIVDKTGIPDTLFHIEPEHALEMIGNHSKVIRHQQARGKQIPVIDINVQALIGSLVEKKKSPPEAAPVPTTDVLAWRFWNQLEQFKREKNTSSVSLTIGRNRVMVATVKREYSKGRMDILNLLDGSGTVVARIRTLPTNFSRYGVWYTFSDKWVEHEVSQGRNKKLKATILKYSVKFKGARTHTILSIPLNEELAREVVYLSDDQVNAVIHIDFRLVTNDSGLSLMSDSRGFVWMDGEVEDGEFYPCFPVLFLRGIVRLIPSAIPFSRNITEEKFA